MLQEYINRAFLAKAAHDERVVRGLLERWVSEMEPAVAYRHGEIIGLCVADAAIGTYPFILER